MRPSRDNSHPSLYRSVMDRIYTVCTAAVSLIVVALPLAARPSSSRNAEAIKRECMEMIDRFDYRNLERNSLALIAISEKDGSKETAAYGYAYLGGARLFNGKTGEVRSTLEKSIDLAASSGNDTILSIAYNTLGIYEASVERNLYLAQRHFLKSRQCAKDAAYHRIEKTIGSNLAELAIELQDTNGIQFARECYDYGRNTDNPRFEYSGAINLAELYLIKEDFEHASAFAESAMRLAMSNGYRDLGQINMIQASIVLAKGQLKCALDHARLAVEKTSEENSLALPKAYLMLGRILTAMGDHRNAIETLQKALQAANQYSSFSSVVDIYALMADNYEAIGENINALKYLRLAKDSTDSGFARERKRLDNERELMLDLQKKESDIRMHRMTLATQKKLILSLCGSVVLLIAILVIVIINQRKRKRLYSNIVSNNIRIVEMRDAMEERSIPSATKKEEAPCGQPPEADSVAEKEEKNRNSIKDEKSGLLYGELCRLMKEEKLFSDAKITREDIVERLGTNRTYLTQIISRNGWDNYSQFVNSFRIDEAIRILKDPQRSTIKLSDLSAALGFGTLDTFTKAFRSVTGVTPTVFRKSLNDSQNVSSSSSGILLESGPSAS